MLKKDLLLKNKAKSLIILALGIVMVAGGAMAYNGTAHIVVEGDMNYSNNAEGMVGGVTVEKEYFGDGIVESGSTYSLNTSANTTLTASQVCQNKTITITPGALSDALNITLPTSATIISRCLGTTNDEWTLYYDNGSATAATTTTFVAGTDMELIEHDGGDVVIPGAEDAILTFRNAGSGVIKAYIMSMKAAD